MLPGLEIVVNTVHISPKSSPDIRPCIAYFVSDGRSDIDQRLGNAPYFDNAECSHCALLIDAMTLRPRINMLGSAQIAIPILFSSPS